MNRPNEIDARITVHNARNCLGPGKDDREEKLGTQRESQCCGGKRHGIGAVGNHEAVISSMTPFEDGMGHGGPIGRRNIGAVLVEQGNRIDLGYLLEFRRESWQIQGAFGRAENAIGILYHTDGAAGVDEADFWFAVHVGEERCQCFVSTSRQG